MTMKLAYSNTRGDGAGRFVTSDEDGNLYPFTVEHAGIVRVEGGRKITSVGPIIRPDGVALHDLDAATWVRR